MDEALEELRGRLGPLGVLADGPDRYRTPARGRPGGPAPVLRPTDTGEVRTCVAWARHHRVRLLPQGANSGLVGASTPPPDPEGSLVVLSTDRLRRPPTIDPVDRTAVVDAGVRLSELNDAAAPHGLRLSVDLGADPSIGGMVATNTGGSRMLRYGDVRRHVLGVRAVLADEVCSVVDELTTLRKHNTGPPLTSLLIGSGGAFGVVTEVALELDRVPTEVATAWLTPSRPHDALEVLRRLEVAVGDTLSAFEVCSSESVDAARRHPARPPDPLNGAAAPPLLVLVELSGAAGTEASLLSTLGDLHDAGLISDAVPMPPTDAWALRHLISEGLAIEGTVIGHDVSVPRSALPEARSELRRVVTAAHPGLKVADFGHWGDGGMHLNVVVPHDAPLDADQRTALTDLVLGTVVTRFGGSFSAEHGVGPHNARWWERTAPDGTRRALRELKAAVDPLGVLGHPDLPY
jgi:FAD/FMN-containing dehydrogenase